MKIVITGGGTGGHIYPGLSVGLELVENGWDALYIGSKDGLEKSIIPKTKLKFESVMVAPLPRKISPVLFSSLIKNSRGFFQARKLMKEFEPDIVLGTGGFVAGSVVLAASLMGIPTIIHEQNVYPGITNRLLSRVVDQIALNFADAREYLSDRVNNKTVVTGNPIRKVILNTDKATGIKQLGLDSAKRTLLVFGGSQGAVSINQAMTKIYQHVSNNNDIQLIHLTGKKNYDNMIKSIRKNIGIKITDLDHIKVMPYLENIEWAYAVADLIIYRAGATGLAEITAKGIPSILIPYPHAAGNHQLYNARTMKEHSAGEVIREEELTAGLLYDKVTKILNNDPLLKKMAKESYKLGQPEARVKIINQVKNLLNK
jgi:UDP-N-acetylglucosamine--N-acetylmuramyl-(pentapeptide) pyrophosphoryl-undecaprenol N-acetylglucosamine transferase